MKMFLDSRKKGHHKKDNYPLLTNKDIDFSFAEAFRVFAVNLRFTFAQKISRKVIITGANEDMGKTMISANLAIALAQSGFKVMILDCDIRNPSMHKIFNDENVVGLTHLLCDEAEYLDAVKHSEVENLDYITSGIKSPNPLKLLLSQEMTTLLENLTKEYDWIIMDTPPVNVVSDALILCNNSDGVVLVVEEKVSEYKGISKAIEQIKYVNGNLLGIVLNRVTKNPTSKYYKYGYGSK